MNDYMIQPSINQSGFTVRGLPSLDAATERLRTMPNSNYSIKRNFGGGVNDWRSVYLCSVRNGRVSERPDVYGRYLGIMEGTGYAAPELHREEYFG